MTIGRKITLTCVTLVLFTVVVGAISTFRFQQMNVLTTHIGDDPIPGLNYIASMYERGSQLNVSGWSFVTSRDAAHRAEFAEAIQQARTDLDTVLKGYDVTISRDDDRALFARIKQALQDYNVVIDQVQKIANDGHPDQALDLFLNVARTKYKALREVIDLELILNRDTGDQAVALSLAEGHTAQVTALFLTFAAALVGSLLAFFSIRGINRALSDAAASLMDGAQQMASAASQVAASSQSLAQSASEQSASIQETTSAAERATAMASKNSANAEGARHSAKDSATIFETANTKLRILVHSMDEINTTSGKISKIIKVIDQIAFQTNILALNAAVEAARAGESGAGFAVVADEVRNLAQRSAGAAKDTAALIEEAISRIAEGTRHVAEVERALDASTSQSMQINQLVDQIGLGSTQQSAGLNQIRAGVDALQRVSESTASNAEESAAAAEELNAQVESVVEIVEQLRSLIQGPTTHRISAVQGRAAAPAYAS